LKQNPETAAKLVAYVKAQTKKNQQREWRRRRDVERRAKKAREKILNNGKFGAAGQGIDNQNQQAASGLTAAQMMQA